MRSFDSSVVILALLNVRGIGVSRVRTLAERARAAGQTLSPSLMTSGFGAGVLSEEQAKSLPSALMEAEHVVLELRERGIVATSFLEPEYPARLVERLGRLAPPLLFAMGDLGLTRTPSVGFCGSRRASDKGLGVTQDIAEQLARNHVTLVSGYAAGVDTQVHSAALHYGTATIVVLAEGISHFRVKRDLRSVWQDERVLILSEFLPGLPWNARQAMQRNSTICALSDAMVLIEAGESGGSIAAGRTAISIGVPLFAPVYDGMPPWAEGNRIVLREGAHPLMKDRKSERANVNEILRAIESDNGSQRVTREPKKSQLTFLDGGSSNEP